MEDESRRTRSQSRASAVTQLRTSDMVGGSTLRFKGRLPGATECEVGSSQFAASSAVIWRIDGEHDPEYALEL